MLVAARLLSCPWLAAALVAAVVLGALGLAWAQDEEERVIGVEGVVESVSVTLEVRSTDGGRPYQIATLTLVLTTSKTLTVFEDMSRREAAVDGLRRDFAAAGRDHLVYVMEALVKADEPSELDAYAQLAAGTRVVVRGPYAAVVEHVRGATPGATAYRIETITP